MSAHKLTANISAIQSKMGLLRNEIVRKEVRDQVTIDHISSKLSEVESFIDYALTLCEENTLEAERSES